jgi:hypothetical protein
MRLLPAVDPPVRVERRRRREALGAHVTDVRPLARVDTDVTLEQRGTVKALAAVVAREHRLVTTSHDRSLLNGLHCERGRFERHL